jgi:uncharacterized delta-60 repeat protein
MIMKQHLLFVALLVVCATNAQAQSPGSLDNTFGSNGLALADLSAPNRYDEFATQVLIQPDGKRVVVVDRYPYLQLIRFNADGSYDNSFGDGGFSQAAPISHFGGPNSNAAIQADGKIVVAGETAWNSTSMTDFGIVRWNTNGSLDFSFGTHGLVTLDFSNYWDTGEMVRIQPDGKIVVAGEVDINNQPFIGLARLNPADGSLDATYGVGGKYVNVPDVNLTDMSLTPDGKLMCLGDNNSDDFVLVRFTGNGILDTSFGTLGSETYNLTLGSYHPFVRCLAVQSDGKLLIGGSVYNSVNSDMFVARFSAAGALDGSFSGDGMQTTHIGGSEDVRAMVVQPDGKIVAAGEVYYGNLPTVFALARYNPNGDLDGTFGVQGTQITSFSGYEGASASAVALQADGDITAAGGAANGFHDDVAIATYDVQGAPDQDGYPVQKFVAYYADDGATYFFASDVQPDGKLVSAGRVWNGLNYDMVVARFNLDGTPDASFGTGGSTRVDLAAIQQGTGDEQATALAIQADGKIVISGSFFGFIVGGGLAVARLNANGTLDATFGTGGLVDLDLPGIFEEGNAALIQPDGKIVIAGSTNLVDFDFLLCRLNPNGTLDNTFGTGGVVTTDWGYQDMVFGLALQPDGKLVATGNTCLKNSFDAFDFNTARYNANGTLDAGFGTGGRVTTDFGGGVDFAQAVALQSNGGLFVAGGGPIGNDYQLGLARYGTTGAPDLTFGSNGLATLGFLGYDIGMAVALQNDAKILVAGFTDGLGGDAGPVDIALARFKSNGTPDAAFGTGGKVTADFGNQEWGYSMRLYKRRIYVTGFNRVFRPFTATDKIDGLVATFLTGPPTADEQAHDLIDKINNLPGLSFGTKQSLNAKLQAALTSLAAADTDGACHSLQALVNNINAQTGKKLTNAQAADLLADVQAMMVTLGCSISGAAMVLETEVTVGTPAAAEGPTRFALHANSPNPFVGATRIAYDLATTSKVSLKIYNVLGQLVATVVDGVEGPGWKSVSWDASRVPPGVYFYRLKAGDFSSERKMLIVR